MATTYSVEYNKVLNPATNGATIPQEVEGKIRMNFFSKTCESEAVASTIYLTKLPAGARVLNVRWASEDLGGTNGATIEIGDSGDTDRLVSAFDVSTAALAHASLVLRTPTTITPDIGFGYKYTSDTWILATTAAQALNTGKFWGCIEYVVD